MQSEWNAIVPCKYSQRKSSCWGTHCLWTVTSPKSGHIYSWKLSCYTKYYDKYHRAQRKWGFSRGSQSLLKSQNLIYFCPSPQGTIATSTNIFGFHPGGQWWREGGGERPGMLLNILQCPGHSPRYRIIQSQIPLEPRLRNPGWETQHSENCPGFIKEKGLAI